MLQLPGRQQGLRHSDRRCDCGTCKLCKNRIAHAKAYAINRANILTKRAAEYSANAEKIRAKRKLSPTPIDIVLDLAALAWLQDRGFRERNMENVGESHRGKDSS